MPQPSLEQYFGDVLARDVLSGRVAVIVAGVLAVLATAMVLDAPSEPNFASFHAGYTAAGNPGAIRGAMQTPGATAESLCDRIWSSAVLPADVVPHDFAAGCRRAVMDSME